MTDSLVHVVVDAAPNRADVTHWRAAVTAGIAAGDRLITLFGRPAEGGVLVTAVLQRPTGALSVERAVIDPATGFHALTEDHPAAHIFERELHEQHGVRVAGHPWLKPVRFERTNVDDYRWLAFDGKEIHEVQVGPIHAGVIEPGAFRFLCHGETVHHLEIHLGYQHRGVEAQLLRRDPRALGPLVEVIAGDTSVAHAWAWAGALEALSGATTDPHAPARAVMLELERIAMHLAGLAGLATDVGFLQGGSTYGRLRTTAINTSMRLCGSRFGRTAVRAGGSGVRRDAEIDGVVRANLDLLTTDLAIIHDRFFTSATVHHRLATAGIVSRERAVEVGLVGPSARSSGVGLDQRVFSPSLYPDHPVHTRPTGDCWARAEQRAAEIDTSLAAIRRLLDRAPTWSAAPPALGPLAPDRLAISVVEGWRGEVVHAVETTADGSLRHYKVQDPSIRNWLGLALAVRGNPISDFPICNKSFDLSYCGNDL
jgi:Ni,Fe-hydrogenase III large subunit